MFLLITLIVLAVVAYIYWGYAKRALYMAAPVVVAGSKISLSTVVGVSRDARALHIDNELDNLEQSDLADAIDVFSAATKFDASVSTVFNHRDYRHNALSRLDAAKARRAARKNK